MNRLSVTSLIRYQNTQFQIIRRFHKSKPVRFSFPHDISQYYYRLIVEKHKGHSHMIKITLTAFPDF